MNGRTTRVNNFCLSTPTASNTEVGMTSYGKWSYSTLEMRVLLTHLGMKQLFPNSSCPRFIYEVVLLTGHFSISFFIYSVKNFRCLWRENCLFLVFTRTVKFFIKSERIVLLCFFFYVVLWMKKIQCTFDRGKWAISK